ncbi:hypothetical protein OEZ86_003424 [Tetradesmus obliquus]|uniref:DUF155 domain-containing protein n=1 Tax=Tetradesmus obliquus TaxID=3088 RepID=A0ABY8TTJ3_TETOB|nr:hypothetical protein OEZ85_012499 [Tetradesmus obliquus]WIA32621.1 hypothetical protein OEZ86_003424 [Tetradesmus obliquus]
MSTKHHRSRQQGPLVPLHQPLLSASPPNHDGRWMRRPTTSPGPEARGVRQMAAGRPSRQLLSLSSQQIQNLRQKDKWVPLPEDDDEDAAAAAAALAAAPDSLPASLEALHGESLSSLATGDDFTALTIAPGMFQDLDASRARQQRGRITLYCPGDSFDRKKLDEVLRASFPASAIKSYPDVFYVEYFAASDDAPGGDLFFFDYGVVACWGLDSAQEAAVMRTIAHQAANQPVDSEELEVDQFEFNYSSLEKPHIQNDTVTLHKKAAKDHQVKLAISYALAQSTKLSLHERRVSAMVVETKHLPESLAASGKVALSPETIAKLIGKVFIQKAAVNLLSSVLDTPEFFWRAPDSFQALYERICEYLELEQRVEVLNARFAVLQEMLDMLRDHQNNHHSARLEWIVIYLIMVEVVVGLLEVLGLFGLVGNE